MIMKNETIYKKKVYYQLEDNNWYYDGKNGQTKVRQANIISILENLNNITPDEELHLPTEDEVYDTGEITGLGDSIKRLTNYFGIEQCTECKHRQIEFNKLFPYLSLDNLPELTEEEIGLMGRLADSRLITSPDVDMLFKLYNRMFKAKVIRCNCPGLVKQMIARIVNAIHIKNNK